MPSFNFIAIGVAALIPLFIGYFWYHPSVFGKQLASLDKNNEGPKTHHMMVYILTLVGSFLIAMLLAAILSTHSEQDHTMVHGFFHGGSAAVFMGIPTFAIIALFESKPAKYILIHAFYWLVCMVMMGGVIGWF